jgi:hypothetical protein
MVRSEKNFRRFEITVAKLMVMEMGQTTRHPINDNRFRCGVPPLHCLPFPNLRQDGGQTASGTPWHVIRFGESELIKAKLKDTRMNWEMCEYVNGSNEITRSLSGIREIQVLSAKAVLRAVISLRNGTSPKGTKAGI